jgi:hypothetical protein
VARCRVVLSLEDDFAPHLVETLLSWASPGLQQLWVMRWARLSPDRLGGCAPRLT